MTSVLLLSSEKGIIEERAISDSQASLRITSCQSVMAATALVEEMRPCVVITDVSLRGAKDFLFWLRRTTGCASLVIVGKDESADIPGWICDAKVPAGITQAELQKVIEELVFDSRTTKATSDDDTSVYFEGESEIDGSSWDDRELDLLSRLPSDRSNGLQIISQEVIALWGAKGGEGRTTVALMLAQALQDFDTVLIDLNFREGPGDVGIALNLPMVPHIGRLLDEPADRRRGFMDTLIKPKRVGFAVIQPPPTIDQAEKINPDDVIDLIDQARRVFQVVILDLPADLSAITLEAVDLCTSVLFVASEHAGGLARLESLKSYVRKDISQSLVLNRFDGSAGGAREISHLLDMPLAAVIPEAESLKNCKEKRLLPRKYDNVIHQRVDEILKLIFGVDKTSSEGKGILSRLFRGA